MTEPSDLIQYFVERFGFPRDFFSSGQLSFQGRTWWLGPAQTLKGNLLIPNEKILRRGLKVARGEHFPFKPTTFFVQRFGHHATKNFLLLEGSRARNYFLRKPLKLVGDQKKNLTRGYIFVRVGEHFVGCASYRNEILYSDFPKRLSAEIHDRGP
jgi:NOL1/NOP2/fmu family ribosome biogenesis protein